jgi:peptide chain release factor subunit 1
MNDLPNVLVLTPMKTAGAYLETYASLLDGLDWPRQHLAIGILEGDSTDGTWAALEALRPRLEARAARVSLHRRDFGFHMPPGVPRWAPAFQQARRQVLARARNQLLFRALEDEDYVLWVDVDLQSYPADVLHRLIATGFDIVTPNCVLEPGGESFDRNAWTGKGTVTLDMRRGEEAVRLQSVGGTMLLVRADLHRDGLVFPPFRYGNASANARDTHPVWGRGEIETEGLGIMALDMGVQPWGLPDLEIIHWPS